MARELMLEGLALFAGLLFSITAAQGAEPPFTAFSAGRAEVVVTRDGEDCLKFGVIAWGPNWAWTGLDGAVKSEAGAAVGELSGKLGGTGVRVRLRFRVSRPDPRRLEFRYQLQAEQPTDLTSIVVELAPGKKFEGRDAIARSQGRETAVRCPFQRRGLGSQVESVRMTDAQGKATVIRLDPPCDIASDGPARIVLAKDRLPGGETAPVTLTVELPDATAWYPSEAELPEEPGIDAWYPWQAGSETGESVLGMEDWLDAPAGKHGRILRQGDKLLYNGRPIKLWGLNLCYGACAPEKSLADKRAALYRKYGINAVRLHKFADGPGWAGIQSKESCVQFDPAALKRMDYQVARLKEAGIFFNLSAHFGTLKLGPADKELVPYLEEFGGVKGGDRRIETPHSAIHYSPELQRVQALQMVNLLKHKNPYTGLTYAEDPAIAYIEIVNEQCIFFYTSMAPLKASATLRSHVGKRFCAWLRTKYGGQERLEKAWGGRRAFDSFQGDGFPAVGERLDKDNILPLGNPWYWDPDQLKGSQAFRKQRLLDSLEFLYGLQVEFFRGFGKAVREAGYRGEMLGSNWQAGRAFSHFANLHADWLVGTIDRHNYFGGGRANATMLARAGSGMLSSGMQQAIDRPFMLSEWIHVFPNEFGVEGPAILGAYGMGLQGWDASFLFQNGDDGAFSHRLGRQEWDVTAPQILGVFPAVARQILRGDVEQSEVLAVRNVHMPSLFEGKLSFDDKVAQGYDDKELDSRQVPARALAVARSVIAFPDAYTETPPFDMKRYEREGELVSSTGQLRWRESPRMPGGAFTIDAPGVKAAVGFAQGRRLELGAVTIEPQSTFAAIYVTARERDRTIESSRDLLLVAIARARNSGMKFSPSGDRLLAPGKAPILMEPVKAAVTIRKPGSPKVFLLDHDGKLTDRTLPAENGQFTIDGARDKTPYYVVRY